MRSAALERADNGCGQHLDKYVLRTVLLEPQKFGGEVHGLGRELLDRDYFYIFRLGIGLARFMDGAPYELL